MRTKSAAQNKSANKIYSHHFLGKVWTNQRMDLWVNHQELLKNGHHLLWLPNKDTKSANRLVLLPRAVLGAAAASVWAQTRSFLHMLMLLPWEQYARLVLRNSGLCNSGLRNSGHSNSGHSNSAPCGWESDPDKELKPSLRVGKG